jgi:TRAP transporter 4TM/12TM fusion protein
MVFSIFHIYTGYFQLEAMDQRIVHLMFGYCLIFLVYSFNGKKDNKKINLANIIPSIVYVGISLYFLATWHTRAENVGLPLPLIDYILGIIIVVLTIDGARRSIGWTLPIMSIIMLFFALFGESMPPMFMHRNYQFFRIIYNMTLKTDGLYGLLTGLSATFIFLLVLFGVLYNKSGAGDFFMDFAMSFVGHMRGGIAKVSIIASTLFGMISGSGVANTAAVGNITIGAMKKRGYDPNFAAAVVATAGSGGLIMPPIMGSAIFIMMAVTGVPYFTIMLRSFVIAFLFYSAVFIMVDFYSMKNGIKGESKDKLKNSFEVFKGGWNYLIPPVLLVILLSVHVNIIRSVFWAIIAIPFSTMIRKSTRLSLKDFLKSLSEGAISALTVVAILSTASIIVGLVNFTGLGVMISTILLKLAGGNLFLLLVLTMISSIILGMGVPPVAAYIVLSILVTPALIKMGVWFFAAHMFVFYFSVLAEITPPVAPNAYVASGIAKSNFLKTAFIAMKLAFPVIICPYIFVYNNALLMRGTFWQVVTIITFSLLTTFLLSCAFERYYFVEMNLLVSIILGAGAILIVFNNFGMNILGFLIIGIITIYSKMQQKKKNALLI